MNIRVLWKRWAYCKITVLLQIGAVLEYNGTRWCDLHPLVEKWLIENNKITG